MMTHPLPRYQPTHSGRKALQDRDEFQWFLNLISKEQVRRYGEIGARSGDTFHAVMTSLPVGSVGVAVDLPASPHRTDLESAVSDLCSRGYLASAMFGDSTMAATIKQFCGRGPFDLILIDGHHALEYATSDWNNYRSMARIIAFHDIAGSGQKNSDGTAVEVPVLWRSIKGRADLRTTERISKGSKMGIGVVWT